ncbi:MAG: dihydrolipoamide acetyltransferase component of pyruvate dehydrogenase complex [Candidatus Hydrogenedentota bacterium]
MATLELRVPQLGEGLVEVRIVQLLKKPGDEVDRDEPLYTMETDKAEVDIESPALGVLTEWFVEANTIVPVGTVVAHMEAKEAVPSAGVSFRTVPDAKAGSGVKAGDDAGPRNAVIPPRTRAYARSKGLTIQEVESIPAGGAKLMPDDVDAYLARKAMANGTGVEYDEVPMSARQRTLFYRLSHGSAQVVPGTIEVPVSWEPVERVYARFADGDTPKADRPSRFMLVAWAAAQAVKEFDTFRSTIQDVNTLRRYKHVNIGIAVALPDDELVTALVQRADALPFDAFAREARARIDEAREGHDQAHRAVVHLSITGLHRYGIRSAVPVVVPPSVATLFVGAPYDAPVLRDGVIVLQKTVNLALTFDHRIINGAGAASFLNHVVEKIGKLDDAGPGQC